MGVTRPRARGTRFSFGGEELLVISVDTSVAERPSVLTESEWAVCLLVLDGCDNAQIAATRCTAVRTVANQLASIYAKLSVGSRAELCAFLRRT